MRMWHAFDPAPAGKPFEQLLFRPACLSGVRLAEPSEVEGAGGGVYPKRPSTEFVPSEAEGLGPSGLVHAQDAVEGWSPPTAPFDFGLVADQLDPDLESERRSWPFILPALAALKEHKDPLRLASGAL